MDDSRLVEEAIQGLVDSRKEVSSWGELAVELKKELGNRGRRYLGRLSLDEVEGLYERYTVLRQKDDCLSPADTNLDSDIAGSSYSEPMRGPPLAGLPDRSQQQQHAPLDPLAQHPRFPDQFDIMLVPVPGLSIIKNARCDRQLPESIVDLNTAASFCGRATADLRPGSEIVLRWRRLQNGLGTGREIHSLCKIGGTIGVDVVFGRDLDLVYCDENNEPEGGQQHRPVRDEGEGRLYKMIGHMNVEAARKLIEDEKRAGDKRAARAADSRDESQGKRTRFF